MIDIQKQSMAIFERDSKEFHVTLRLVPQSEVLQIKVENSNTLERYYQLVDQEYVSNQPDFKLLFEEPIDLFDYLTNHFEEIIVSEAAINFDFKFNGTRKRVKPLIINLMKEEITQSQMADRKFEKMMETLTSEISKKTAQMDSIKEQMQKSLAQKITEIQALKKKWQAEADKNIHMNRQISKLNEQNAKKDSQSLKLKQSIFKNDNPWIEALRISNVNVFNHHPNNPYQSLFQLKQLNKDQVSIRRALNSPEPGRFINECGLCFPHKISYTIEKIKCTRTKNGYKYNVGHGGGDQQIFVGLCTLDNIANSFRYQDIINSGIYYSFGTGKLLQKGKIVMTTQSINFTDYAITIDVDSKKIKFSQNGNAVVDLPIPKEMVGNTLHFSVWLLNGGDQIKVTYK